MADFPIACDLSVLTDEQHRRLTQIWEEVIRARQEVSELSNGYGLRFPSDVSTVLTLAEFMTLERLCCPFFEFTLEVTPGSGPVWLRLTGGDGVKEFISQEFSLGSHN